MESWQVLIDDNDSNNKIFFKGYFKSVQCLCLYDNILSFIVFCPFAPLFYFFVLSLFCSSPFVSFISIFSSNFLSLFRYHHLDLHYEYDEKLHSYIWFGVIDADPTTLSDKKYNPSNVHNPSNMWKKRCS